MENIQLMEQRIPGNPPQGAVGYGDVREKDHRAVRAHNFECQNRSGNEFRSRIHGSAASVAGLRVIAKGGGGGGGGWTWSDSPARPRTGCLLSGGNGKVTGRNWHMSKRLSAKTKQCAYLRWALLFCKAGTLSGKVSTVVM